MQHVKAMAMKFISVLVLLFVILGLFYGMSFGSVFLISLVLGIASYIIGDLFILPRTNNMIATIADFGLALLVIWVMTENMVIGEYEFTVSLIAAAGVALFEYFFHIWLSTFIPTSKTMVTTLEIFNIKQRFQKNLRMIFPI